MEASDVQADIAATLLEAPRKKNRIRCFFWFLLLLALAAAAFFFLSPNRQDQRSGRDRMEYTTDTVSTGDLIVTVTGTGTLQPTNEVDVGSELSGNIEAVMVDFNDQVTEGQVLARLDVSKLNAQVTQTEASLAAAKARVALTKATVDETAARLRQLEKVKKISGGKLPARAEMDNAKATAARARADKAGAEAGVAEVQARLDITLNELAKAEIISPVNGIVLSRDIEKGQTVAASFSAPVLFKLAEDLTKMELHVAVDEADIGQVREGQEAVFTVDAYPERKFSAVIRQVRFASTVTDGVVTYETVLMVANTDLALRPGMTATAEIVVRKVEQALTVPNAALRFRPSLSEKRQQLPGLLAAIFPRRSRRRKQPPPVIPKGHRQHVWVLRKEGTPRKIEIRTGLTDGVRTEVTKGDLAEGEQVVTVAINSRRTR